MGSVTDNFTGAAGVSLNGHLDSTGTAWVADPDFVLDGSGGVFNKYFGRAADNKGFTPAGADVDVTIGITVPDGTPTLNSIGVAFRRQLDGSRYVFGNYNGYLRFYRIDAAGTDAGLGLTATVAAGTYHVTARGNVLSAYLNGGSSPILTVTDATIAGSGGVGLWSYQGQATGGTHITSFAAQDPAGGGGPHVPGVLTLSAINASSMAAAVSDSGGTGPFSYQYQDAPVSTGPWTNIAGAPTTNPASLPVNPGQSGFRRAVITDAGAGNATSTTPAVAYSAPSLILADNPAIHYSGATWFPHPTIPHAMATNHAGAEVTVNLATTANVTALFRSTSGTAGSNTVRVSVDKGAYSANLPVTPGSPTVPILVGGVVGNHPVRLDVLEVVEGDLAGATATPDWLVFLGFEVDSAATASAYSPAPFAGLSLIHGDSWTAEGGINSQGGETSVGAILRFGLGSNGGQIGNSGGGYTFTKNGWTTVRQQVLNHAVGIPRTVGGVLNVDRVVLAGGRNDGDSVANLTSEIQADIAAIRAACAKPIHLVVPIAGGGGYPISLNIAQAIHAVGVNLASDTKLFIHDGGPLLADGNNYLLDGRTPVAGDNPGISFTGYSPHESPEFYAKHAAWLVGQILQAEAVASAPAGGGGAASGLSLSDLQAELNARGLTSATTAKIGGPVASVAAPVTVGAVNDKSGYSLAASGLDAVPVEAGLNARQALSPIAAFSAGVLAGAGTGTITIAAAGSPSVPRISATTDASGNRTSITLHLPA